MSKGRSKGLSSYPVFILTIVSIIAIGFIALRAVEATIETNIVNDVDGSFSQVKPRYVMRDGALYVEIPHRLFDKVHEIIVFSNDSYMAVELRETGGLYGPLVLHMNASLIYIVGARIEGQLNKPYLIDVLSIEKRSGSIKFSSREVHPPALRFVTSGGLSIYSMNYLHGMNRYHKLKPITTSKTSVLENGYVYEVRDKQVLRKDHSPQPLHIFSGILNLSDVNINDRLGEIIDRYGSITERIWFNLTRRFSGVITRTPTRASFLGLVAWNRFNITIPERLVKGFKANYSSLEIRINHAFNISAYDINGVEYDTQVTVSYYLRLSSREGTRSLYLGTLSVSSPRQPYLVSLNKTLVIEEGVYDINLSASYYIRIINPPRVPIYPYFFIIKGDQVAYGGFENYVFAKVYSIDTLEIRTNNDALLYYPLDGNISLMVDVRASLYEGYIVTVGGMTLVSDHLEIKYTGKQVYVEDYANPTMLLETPVYVETTVLDPGARLYHISISINEALVGIYTRENQVTIRFLFKPAVRAGSEVVIINNSYTVYLLNSTAGLRLYLLHNGTLTHMDLPVDTRFYGFVVLDTVVFDEAALLIDHSLTSYSVKVRLIFHQSEALEVEANRDLVVELPHDIVVSIEVSILSNNFPSDVNIVFSSRAGREVVLFTENYLGLVKAVFTYELPDRCVRMAVLYDNSAVLYE